MNRKILSVLTVLIAVLVSTAALAACDNLSTEQGGKSSVSESTAESGAQNGAQRENAAESGAQSGAQRENAAESGEDTPKSEAEKPASAETGYSVDENGVLSAKMLSLIPDPPEWYYERVLHGEAVGISFNAPAGWECVPLYGGQSELLGLSFTSDSSDKSDGLCRIFVYKDGGRTYEQLTDMNFLLLAKDDRNYFEVETPYAAAASYALTYFSGRQADTDDVQPSYLRSYQLQFDGYVVGCDVFLNAGDAETLAAEEAACDEFIASLKLL